MKLIGTIAASAALALVVGANTAYARCSPAGNTDDTVPAFLAGDNGLDIANKKTLAHGPQFQAFEPHILFDTRSGNIGRGNGEEICDGSDDLDPMTTDSPANPADIDLPEAAAPIIDFD